MERHSPNESPEREPALAWLRRSGAPAEGTALAAAAPGAASFFAGSQAARALETWLTGGEALADLEDRSAFGESIAARSLAAVHAVIVALSGAETKAPRDDVRGRLLASAAEVASAAERAAEHSVGGPAEPRPSQLSTLIPPVIAVGLAHAARPEEPARRAAIARFDADRRDGDVELEKLLARVEEWLDFPLLVVSVVHAGETVHRAHHTKLSDPPRVVPREASYCTHCVAGDAPLVVEDARRDAFFSKHPAVGAFGLVAYCGVPLRVGIGTSAEAVIGTLCGYDVRARPVLVEDAATLEIFARRAASLLEQRIDDPAWSDAGSRGQSREVLAPGPFLDLALVAMRRAASSGRGRSALLVGPPVTSVPHDDSLTGDGYALAAGRLPDGRSAWLLHERAGASVDLDDAARDIAQKLTAVLRAPVGVSAVGSPDDDPASVMAWIDRAAARAIAG